MPRKVLAAVDFSNDSTAVMEEAKRLWEQEKAEITVIHAYQIFQMSILEFSYTIGPDVIARACESAGEAIEQLAEAVGLPTEAYRAEVVTGDAANCVCEAAKDSDLVLVGTRGRSALEHLLIGSVAERILRHAPCSVLVVKSPAKAAEKSDSPATDEAA